MGVLGRRFDEGEHGETCPLLYRLVPLVRLVPWDLCGVVG